MDSADRRRTPRHPAGWTGRYLVEQRQDGWYDCRMVDVSLGGAALELFGPAPLFGAGLRIEIPEIGPAFAGVQLRGSLRNLRPSALTGIRTGIEWGPLTRAERELVVSLMQQQAAEAS